MKKLLLCLLTTLALTGCRTSAGVGVGVPIGPFNIGVGLGTGGVSAGVSTGVGPVGVGVGVNQSGQVTGNAGIGTSTSVGGARVGASIGTSTVLHDPNQPRAVSAEQEHPQPASSAPVAPTAVVPSAPEAMQWRDASGSIVPTCRVQGAC